MSDNSLLSRAKAAARHEKVLQLIEGMNVLRFSDGTILVEDIYLYHPSSGAWYTRAHKGHGDFAKELLKYIKEVRMHANMSQQIQKLLQDIPHTYHNYNEHVMVDGTFHYWPSTGKWSRQDSQYKVKQGGFYNILVKHRNRLKLKAADKSSIATEDVITQLITDGIISSADYATAKKKVQLHHKIEKFISKVGHRDEIEALVKELTHD